MKLFLISRDPGQKEEQLFIQQKQDVGAKLEKEQTMLLPSAFPASQPSYALL
jgi:hypothetical protein